ncbi:replication initiator protein A, partial [Variovorax sp. J22R115]|uniref:replication initiator protein A n=1 Tax=Variovorax sp. J22R115 TaxID=3053509 RepID=UPI002575E5B2
MDRFSVLPRNGKKTVEVSAGPAGRATQHDKDIVIYCISQLMAAMNAGKAPSPMVRFTAYDLMLSTGRVGKWSPGLDEYQCQHAPARDCRPSTGEISGLIWPVLSSEREVFPREASRQPMGTTKSKKASHRHLG